MKNKFLQYLFLSCSVVVLFSACRKDPFKGEETGESGKTFVWITEADGDPYIQHFDKFVNVKTVVLFTVRRDAANKADLQKAVTVTLTADPDSTAKSGLTPFTSDLYTFPSAADIASGGVYAGTEGISVNGTGNVLTVNFAAGEFAKNIIYKIDGSKLDLANIYGAVYKITNLGGFTGKVGFSVVAAGVAVKNQYDGTYHATGSFTRLNADLSQIDQRAIDQDKYLGTVNGNTLASTVADLGAADPLNLTINADNSVTVTFVGGSVTGLPGPFTQVGDNFYDPATKTFTLHYQYRGGLRNTVETLKKNP